MKQETKTQELQVAQDLSPELLKEMSECYGAGDEVTSQEIIVPRISIQQSNSILVQEDKARPGEIFNTLSFKKLGGKDSPMQFIPIKFVKHKTLKQGQEIISVEPWTPTSTIAYERQDGVKEYETFVYFIITKEDLEEEFCMPARFTFISTSLSAGRRLSSEIARLKQIKIPSWGRYFEMRTILQKKDNNSWWAPDIKIGEAVPMHLQAKAYLWFKTLTSFKSDKIDTLVHEGITQQETIIEETRF